MRIDVGQPDACDVGWFVARQPAVVRYFERQCGANDAFPVSREAAYLICRAIEQIDGVPVPPVPFQLLDRAGESLDMELLVPGGARDGCAERQPELCTWVGKLLANPPIPLLEHESRLVGICLTTLIYALDELTTGREVP